MKLALEKKLSNVTLEDVVKDIYNMDKINYKETFFARTSLLCKKMSHLPVLLWLFLK